MQEMLKQWVCGQNGQVKFTLRGRACNLADMSTGATQTASFLSLLYGIQSDSQHASADQKQRYICFTRTQASLQSMLSQSSPDTQLAIPEYRES